jgi:hypothetical protein
VQITFVYRKCLTSVLIFYQVLLEEKQEDQMTILDT